MHKSVNFAASMMGSPLKKKKDLHEYPNREVGTELYSHVGLESVRRNSIHCLRGGDDKEEWVITGAGNLVLFIDLKSGSMASMQGPANGGVGAVCVHPEKPLFVVGEKGDNPVVAIHEWPSKKRVNVLRNGAVHGFSACAFNDQGNLLATVAIEPDYVITVWDWQKENIVLRNKAFSADVYNVLFNPFDDGLLVTSGSGHIKFWTMATTFTGLKLQGEVGKFGRLEISDVCGAACLPDGKVVSGTESGSILLWEGSLVKCELTNQTATDEAQRKLDEEHAASGAGEDVEAPVAAPVQAHQGPVEVVRMIAKGKVIMTGGHDGYLRYWSTDEIDVAETDGTSIHSGIRLLKEYFVGPNIAINGAALTPNNEHWILQDAHGSLVRAPFWGYEVVMSSSEPPPYTGSKAPIASFSAGPLHHMVTSPNDHTAVTLGDDGSVRLVDYINAKELYHVLFDSAPVKAQFLDTETGDRDGRVLLVAFRDGVLRVLRKTQNTFEMLSASRPHTTQITDFSIDTTSKHIFTISDDDSAFYLKLRPIEFTLEPMGFCQLPAKATSCVWTANGDNCLISFTNGNIIALKPPTEVDHSVGFEFEPKYAGLGYRQKKKPPEKPKNANGEDEDDEPEDLDLDEEDQGPWAVNFVSRCPDGNYMIGVDKPELCYTYGGTVRYDGRMEPTPLPATGIEPHNWVEEPILNFAYRDYIALGVTTSYSRLINVVVCDANKLLIRQYGKIDSIIHTTQLHDGIHGRTSGAMMSYDDKVLVTAGSDGMLFVHKINGIEPPEPSNASANLKKLPVGKQADVEPVARSVQQQKEFDDAEKAQEAAMGKKYLTLKRIKQVHERYDTLFKVNEEKSGGQQISEEEMQLDPDLYKLLDEELQNRVADCAVEYSWESAKKEMQLQKLKTKFVDALQYDHFAVYSFATDIGVRSFRTPHFTEHQKKALESIQDLLAQAQEDGEQEYLAVSNGSMSPKSPTSPTRSGTTPGASGTPQSRHVSEFPGADHSDPQSPMMESNVSSPLKKEKTVVNSQLEKAEDRKRERIIRRKGHDALLKRRPKQHDDDPSFLQEIIRAEKFMGDFILKTSKNYTIPEHSRPTADRKSKQLILLEHSIIELRAAFNVKLLGIRDLKRRLCVQLNKDRNRIREISAQLKQEVEFMPFALLPSEEPEKRFDVSHEELEQFEKEQARLRRKEEAAIRAKKGFGGDLAQAEEPEEEEVAAGVPAPVARRKPSTGTLQKERLDNDIKSRMDALKRTEIEDEEAAITREMLLVERGRLERKVAKTIVAFDDLLLEYFNEKLKLDADLTMADMRVLLLFREFRLLSDFRKRDSELQTKLDNKKGEKHDIKDRKDCIEMEKAKQVPILQGVAAGLNNLRSEFAELVASKAPNAALPLEKMYNRKGLLAKRRRKNQDDGSEDDNESSSDEESSDGAVEDGDDFDEEPGEEACPPNCDEETFAAVLALRELKLDQDEIELDEKTITQKRSVEEKQIKDREVKLDNEIHAVEREIEQFQNEKQRQLNLLSTIVVLKLSQIQCLREDGKLPATYDDRFVVFTQSGLDALRARIVELAEKKIAKGKETNSLVSERARILRKKSRKQSEHSDWEAKVYEVQLLKFGQRVDLEMLENVAVDRETEELKAQLKIEEVKWEKELNKQNQKFTTLRSDQQARIADNTVLLKDLGSLRAEQHDVEERLAQSTQKVVAKMSGGSKVATASDRAHLKDLVVAQQQEIDALKNEIAMLRRKGGHVYTPVVNSVQ